MSESLRILVTDDEPGMRMAVSRALRDFTVHVPEFDQEIVFTVEQAETGEAALEIIEKSPPHILLLDHKLPGISGLDVLERIRQLKPAELLTVMITAYASIETAISATKKGAYDFLAKPFTPAELKETIRKSTEHLIIARQARRLAEEKRRVRFDFIRVLGHELKAPLGAIEGYLQLMKDSSLGTEITAYYPMLDRSMARVQGMRKLIADLLDLTRIESGQKTRQLTDLDVREIAQSSVETLLPLAQERQIQINLHSPDKVPMMGDRGELEIILNNLLSNAVKYNRDGGSISVNLDIKNNRVVISVTDTGIGMTGEEVSRLFGEFVRIKNEKTKNILGSGLGLSILKKLASLYQGSVTVQSKPDEGSTFTVELIQYPEQESTRNEAG